jgi:galactokinase/mevalonate kinase-like predicted kinase
MFAFQIVIIVVYEHEETYAPRIFMMPDIPSTSSLGLSSKAFYQALVFLVNTLARPL